MSRSSAALTPLSARSIAVLSVALLVIVTMAGNSATRLFLWPWFFFGEGLFLLPILWLTWQAARWHRFPSFGGILDLGLIGLGATTLVAAILSPHRWLSLVFAAPYVALVALAYGVNSWLTEEPTRRAEREHKLSITLGLPFALFTILTFGHWIVFDAAAWWSRLGWPAGMPRNEYPFGHSTYTAGLTLLTLPWLAYLAVHTQNRARTFWRFATLCGVFIIPSTSSRGGVLGMAVMLGCAIVVILLRPQTTRAQRQFVLAAASAAIVLLVAFNPRLRELAIKGHWSAASDASNLQRSAMIDAGFRMGRERPLIGYGPGTVPLVYPNYRFALSGGVENVLQLHNTPVQLWAEMGTFGLLFSVLILVGVIRRLVEVWRASKTDVSSSTTSMALFSGVGLVGYAVFSVTDYQLDLPAIAAAVGCYVAILSSVKKLSTDEILSHRRRGPACGIASLVTILLLSGIIPFARVRRLSTQASDALAKGDKRLFVELNTKAARILPRDPVPINQIGAALLEDRASAQDKDVRTLQASNVLQCFMESLRRNPAQEYVHLNFGWLLLELGQPGAADHFRAAADLVPDKGGVYLGLALALQREGHNEGAAAALALECLNDPRFLTSLWWQVPLIAGLQPATAQRLDLFYAQLISRVSNNSPLYAELNYERSLAQWLLASAPATDVAAVSTTQERKDFFSREPLPKRFATSPIRSYRRERTGYPVLMRAPEMLAPLDLYQAQDNQLAETELHFIFPNKGWLPAPLWTHFLGETSRRAP